MNPRTDVPFNPLGAGGVYRGGDPGDAGNSLLDSNGLDYFAGEQPEAARYKPRHWYRRIGHVRPYCTLAQQGSASFSGTYGYFWIHTDAAGNVHYSRKLSVTVSSVASIRVSGWTTGSGAGTVDIYRTTDGGSTYKLVTSGYDAVTYSYYDDSTADGALGADAAAIPTAYVDPAGNRNFDQTAWIDALAFSNNPNETARLLYAVARTNGSGGSAELYVMAVDSGEELNAQSSAPPSLTYPYCLAQLNNLLLLFGPTSAPRFYAYSSSTLSSMSQPSTPSISSISQSAGAITATTGHTYVVQMEDKRTGIRSLPSAPYQIAGPYASKQNSIAFTSPGSNNRAYIYRTTDGGQFFQLVGSTTSTPYVDNTLDTALSAIQVPFAVGAPGPFKFAFAHKGVLIVLNDLTSGDRRGSRVRWSSLEYPLNFPADVIALPRYERDLDKDDGDELTGGYSYGEAAVLFKRRTIYALLGDPPDFRFTPIVGSTNMGCVSFRTLVETPIGLLWLGPHGVFRMAAPGEAPTMLSDAVADLLVEPAREQLRSFDQSNSTDPLALEIQYTQPSPLTYASPHFQVQLDTASDFSSVDFDYDTANATERAYFWHNGGEFPSAGVSLAALAQARVVLIPPVSGGPAAGSTYYARYRAGNGSTWGDWVSLGTLSVPADNPVDDVVNWSAIEWAFAVHMPSRKEVYFWLPTGSRSYCDLVLILHYDSLLRGGPPHWRVDRVPATAGCLLPKMTINGQATQDYIAIGSPDGLLYVYPYHADGIDFDTRATVANADRVGDWTHSGGNTLTASGTSWPTTQYGLAGTLVAARDAANDVYTAIVTANSATTLTVAWLNGRTPANGALTCALGGVAVLAETAWPALSGDPSVYAALREVTTNSTPAPGRIRLSIRGADEQRDRWDGANQRDVDMPLGKGLQQVTKQVHVRGKRHQMKLTAVAVRQDWEVTQLTATVENTQAK